MSMQDLIKTKEELHERIEEKFNACVSNKKFKHNESQARQVWYRQHLHNRIAHKTWLHESLNIYTIIADVIDEILPKEMYKSLDKFVDIKDLKDGEIKADLFLRPSTFIDTQRVNIGCKYIK